MITTTEYGIEVRNLHKTYAVDRPGNSGVRALHGVSLLVNPGELFVLLGPSGCGKSTLLRSVAGLEQPEQGEILMGRRTVLHADSGVSVPPREREVGMVFQNFALYPHMTVAKNVAFGLKTRKIAQEEADRRLRDALRLVEMEEFAGRSPAQLSGGQRQRVALARAVAVHPKVLLFDEPLSNLDPLLRTMLRTELRTLIRRIGITTLFVTHDQEEAMIMGDRLAVMRDGTIEQVGTPEEVYRHPETLFVAGFTGRPVTNLIEGVVERHESGWILVPIESRAETLRLPESLAEYRRQRVVVHVRPENATLRPLTDEGRALASDETPLGVEAVLPEGSHTFVHLHLGGPYKPLVVRDQTNRLTKAAVGGRAIVQVNSLGVYSSETGYLLGEHS
ncbi:MAG: ABC transporter ATP-binding protein [Spirochaetota bacterium]